MAVVISIPETPSIEAWWPTLTRAKLPGGTPSTLSRPSMTYTSHNGRAMSSGREISRAVWMHN